MKLHDELNILKKPDSVSYTDELFGIEKDFCISLFKKTDLVPPIDESYVFDEITTMSIIAGFNHNKRVLIQGLWNRKIDTY